MGCLPRPVGGPTIVFGLLEIIAVCDGRYDFYSDVTSDASGVPTVPSDRKPDFSGDSLESIVAFSDSVRGE